MEFPPTEEEVISFKMRLQNVVQELTQSIQIQEERSRLHRLSDTLENADSDSELMDVYSQLIRDFSRYSEGKDLFGPQLSRRTAPAGEFKVILTVGDQILTSKLKIRDDPLLKK